MWFCYILKCINITNEKQRNLTYNGSTNKPSRRIRQHNGVIIGGAKATKGKQWEMYAILTGFPTHQNCLSCEWRIKKPDNKKRTAKYCGVVGRLKGLNKVIQLKKWTNQCIVNNCDFNMKLYVVEDMLTHIDLNNVPDNIDVYTISKISDKFLKNLEKGKYE